jgi:hypothetical protein
MPNFGTYKIDSKALDPKDTHLRFSISTDNPCEYRVMLLDNDVQSLVENKNYELVSDANGNLNFTFNDKYLWSEKLFTITFDQQMN